MPTRNSPRFSTVCSVDSARAAPMILPTASITSGARTATRRNRFIRPCPIFSPLRLTLVRLHGSRKLRRPGHSSDADLGSFRVYHRRHSCRMPARMAVREARLGLLAIAILLVAGAGAGLWWWLHRPAAPVEWQGYAEADYVKVGPIEPGQLTSVAVARGDQVAAGAPLFAQNDTDERAVRDQASYQLDQAKQQFANLENGGKLTEIQQAEANLDDVRATLVRIRADLQRSTTLLAAGYATKQNVDQLSADYRSAEAKVAA